MRYAWTIDRPIARRGYAYAGVWVQRVVSVSWGGERRAGEKAWEGEHRHRPEAD